MNMPKFIQIIGPQAVGKMTVGQELAKFCRKNCGRG